MLTYNCNDILFCLTMEYREKMGMTPNSWLIRQYWPIANYYPDLE